jgi:protein TonB
MGTPVKHKSFLLIAAFLCSIFGDFVAVAEGVESFDQPPKVITAPSPKYPPSLIGHGILDRIVDGQATVEFTIDAQGKVRDEKVVHETRKEFGSAALDAIRLWKFAPAMKDGHPVSVSRVHQTLYFNATNPDFQLEPADDHGPDRPARVVYSISPKFPRALWDQNIDGDATVRFTVGQDGKAHDARVIEASRKEFGDAALGAIQEWRFTPGTIGWKPADIKNWERHFNFQHPNSQMPHAVLRVPIRIDNPWEWDKRQRAIVQFTVDREGKVRDATVIETSSEDFGQAVISAIVKWKFKPGMTNGQPADVKNVQQDFEFTPLQPDN